MYGMGNATRDVCEEYRQPHAVSTVVYCQVVQLQENENVDRSTHVAV